MMNRNSSLKPQSVSKIASRHGTSHEAEEKDPTPKSTAIQFRGLMLCGLIIFLVQFLGIYLFSRGFLLTRISLSTRSESDTLPLIDHDLYESILLETSQIPKDPRPPVYKLSEEDGPHASVWYPARFQRAILLIIDALRIDFTTPDEGPKKSSHYHNKLPIIDSILKEKGDQSMLYRARADPPTTTLQRLKGLTTGQLPTFIDASSNFAGKSIKEDSWVSQLSSLGTYRDGGICRNPSGSPLRPRNLVFAGDDTWVSVFPDIFSNPQTNNEIANTCGWGLYRPMPSFNVWDLDTVDDGVISRLPFFLLPPLNSPGEEVDTSPKNEQLSQWWDTWRSIVTQKDIMDHSDFQPTKKGKKSNLDMNNDYQKALAMSSLAGGDFRDSWDMIIGHTLGVDHCGHRFGPGKPNMAAKLNQMNTLISLIIEALDYNVKTGGQADTVLYILGDHGMDSMGDHGGESDMEVDAALFIYSPRKGWNADKGKERVRDVFNKAVDHLSSLRLESEVDSELRLIWWENQYVEPKSFVRSLTQIDLVSTLIMTLGLPIPFNNLGAVIPEVVSNDVVKLERPSTSGSTTISEWGFLRALQLNAHQLMSYIHTYMKRSSYHGFSRENILLWHQLFEEAEDSYAHLDQARPGSTEDIKELENIAAMRYYVFLRVTLSSLRRALAQFDLPMISIGLLILVSSTITIMRTIRTLKKNSLTDGVIKILVPGLGKTVLFASSVIGAAGSVLAISLFNSNADLWEAILGGVALGILSAGLISALFKQKTWPFSNTSNMSTPQAPTDIHLFVRSRYLVDWLASAMPIIQSALFSSNSFIFNEDSTILFLLQTLLTALLVCALAAPIGHPADYNKSISPKYRAAGYATALLFISRFSRTSTVCREEQFPNCTPTFYGGLQSSTVTSVPLAIANILTVIIVPLALYFALKRSQSHTLPTIKRWISLLLPISLGLSFLYWCIDSVKNATSPDPFAEADAAFGLFSALVPHDVWESTKLVLARLAFSFALGGGLATWIIDPFCLNVRIVNANDVELDISHTKFKSKQPSKAAIILGFGNTHGSAYLIFLSIAFCVLFIEPQPMGEIMLSSLFVQIILSLELFDALRDCYQLVLSSALEKNQPKPRGSQDSNSGALLPPHERLSIFLVPQITLLILLSYLHYFSTGHQFTLASIQWSSAFVGLNDVHLLFSGILVFMNSVGSFLLVSFALPLVILCRIAQ